MGTSLCSLFSCHLTYFLFFRHDLSIRFLDITLTAKHNITSGKIYKEVSMECVKRF